MDPVLKRKVNSLIAAYDNVVGGIDNRAMHSTDRAYGGIIRAGKGKLLETMTAELVSIAWIDVLKQRSSRLKINKDKMPVITRSDYIPRIKDIRVREYVKTHQKELIYKFGTDVQVYIDGKLVLPIECKTYTENAMIKRILFDAELMREIVGVDTYYLIQLESMLGGDYCELNEVTYGSPATHALLSHVDVDLEIITLLKGERKVDEPIHKKEFFKELNEKELLKAINIFADALSKYCIDSVASNASIFSNFKTTEYAPVKTTKISPSSFDDIVVKKSVNPRKTPTSEPVPAWKTFITPELKPGMKVSHKSFGDGVVIGFDVTKKYVRIKFAKDEKMFNCTSGNRDNAFFNGFLTLK